MMAIIKVGKDDLKTRDSALLELREYFSGLEAAKGRQITFSVRTYGCQLNESDSEKLCGMLESMGLKEHEGESAADVTIFNTCKFSL